MGRNTSASVIDDLRVLSDEVSHNPESGLRHLSELAEYIQHDNEEIRHQSLDVLLQLAIQKPYSMREILDPLMVCFDDKSPQVRVIAQQVGFYLADWWVVELSCTSELLYTIASSTDGVEQYMAVGMLCKLSIYRPDLVTPREEILTLFESIEYSELVRDIDNPSLKKQEFDDAIYALHGGDIESRPLNEDLSPTPNGTDLSKPARLSIHGVWWGLFLPLLPILGLINTAVYISKMSQYTAEYKMKLLLNNAKKVLFFTNIDRATLYCRASVWPTPSEHLPFLPGEKPVLEDPDVDPPEMVYNWGEVASIVRRRDGYQCANCGAGGDGENDVKLYADHQLPRTRGGEDHPNNLRVLCEPCEQARHATIF